MNGKPLHLDPIRLDGDTAEINSAALFAGAGENAVTRMRIDDIRVGERSRKDMGDLNPLVLSIQEVGLLQPIVVQPDGTLVAGARRIEAFRLMGQTEIDVFVVGDLDSTVAALQAERDENTCRKDFTPSEAVALGRRLEVTAKEEAREAKVTGAHITAAKRRGDDQTDSVASKAKGKVAKRVSAALGMSDFKYEHAKKVVEAAESGEPVAVEALAEMDRTGKVEPAYRKVTGTKPRYEPKPFDATASKRNQQVAAKNRERAGTLIGMVCGSAESLAAMNLDAALAASSKEEALGWRDELTEALKRLRVVRDAMKAWANSQKEEV